MDTANNGLSGYLRTLDSMRHDVREGFTYAGIEDYVLDRGTFEVSGPLTDEQRAYVRRVTEGRTFKLKECFYNAQSVALTWQLEGRLVYREGFAQGGTIACHHGWLVLDGERVIDLTWRTDPFTSKARRVRGVIPEGWAYRGVSFTAERVEDQLRTHKEWHCLLDDYKRGYPMLREPRVSPRVVDPRVMMWMNKSEEMRYDE